MRRVFFAAIACLLASNAWAGVTCYRVGNQTICRQDSVPSVNSGSTTRCYQLGNQLRCN
jgi:hypothetical protein